MRYPVWLSSFALFLLLTSVVSGQQAIRSNPTTTTSRGGSEIICEISAFFSLDPENGIQNADEIEGRGLVSCKNDRGFTSDFPVSLILNGEIPLRFFASGELALSANSAPFVVQREISQIDDEYLVRSIRPANGSATKGHLTSLFRGRKHDLAIELKIHSLTEDVSSLKLDGLRVEFDHSAPDWGWGEN